MRLFLAIDLPAAERTRLARVIARLAQSELPVRWAEPESLHITLKFLGETPEARVDEIAAASARAASGCDPFDVVMAGVGAFPSLHRPGVFWIGIEKSARLLHLRQRIEAELSELGFEREAKPFSPHLTIGRVRKQQRVARTDWDRIAGGLVYNGVVRVESVDLMRSRPGAHGARYETISKSVLNG